MHFLLFYTRGWHPHYSGTGLIFATNVSLWMWIIKQKKKRISWMHNSACACTGNVQTGRAHSVLKCVQQAQKRGQSACACLPACAPKWSANVRIWKEVHSVRLSWKEAWVFLVLCSWRIEDEAAAASFTCSLENLPELIAFKKRMGQAGKHRALTKAKSFFSASPSSSWHNKKAPIKRSSHAGNENVDHPHTVI